MSSTETPPQGKPARTILWLIAGQLVTGHVAGAFAYLAGRSPSLRGVVFLGIVFGQLALLGVWAALGSGRWWKGLIGGVFGAGYLTLLIGLGISDLSAETLLVVLFATVSVAVPLGIARMFGVAIGTSSLGIGPAGRIQFSIRDMLILTFVVAFTMSSAKWMPMFSLGIGPILNLLLFGVTFGVVGVLPVWCALATRMPVFFGLGAVALGAFAGCCVGSLAGRDVLLWTTATVTEVVAVTASLLIVRFGGYRLIRVGKAPR